MATKTVAMTRGAATANEATVTAAANVAGPNATSDAATGEVVAVDGVTSTGEVANQDTALVVYGIPQHPEAMQEDVPTIAGMLVLAPGAGAGLETTVGGAFGKTSTQDGLPSDNPEDGDSGHSGSEMDVDDEGGDVETVAGSSSVMPGDEDEEDDGTSSCSTLAEDAGEVSDLIRTVPSKRRRRGGDDSDSDNVVRGRGGRGSRGGRRRRGFKGSR